MFLCALKSNTTLFDLLYPVTHRVLTHTQSMILAAFTRTACNPLTCRKCYNFLLRSFVTLYRPTIFHRFPLSVPRFASVTRPPMYLNEIDDSSPSLFLLFSLCRCRFLHFFPLFSPFFSLAFSFWFFYSFFLTLPLTSQLVHYFSFLPLISTLNLHSISFSVLVPFSFTLPFSFLSLAFVSFVSLFIRLFFLLSFVLSLSNIAISKSRDVYY